MTVMPNVRYQKHLDRIGGVEDYGKGGRTATPADELDAVWMQSIEGKYKQVVGHYLVSKSNHSQERFLDMLTECVTATTQNGFTVSAIVCDQASTQFGCLQAAGVSPANPRLQLIGVDGKKTQVYVVIDVPHCIKNARNALINYNIEFGPADGRMVASWSDLRRLWYLESNKVEQLRLVPKLTDKHINLQLATKMRVRLATNLLSRTTSHALTTYAAYGQIKSKTVIGTAAFCLKMNSIFDLCNTAAPYDAVTKDNLTSKRQEMKDAMDWLESLSFFRVSKDEVSNKEYNGHHFPLAWRISLASFRGLSEDLVGTGIVKKLLFRKLTQVNWHAPSKIAPISIYNHGKLIAAILNRTMWKTGFRAFVGEVVLMIILTVVTQSARSPRCPSTC